MAEGSGGILVTLEGVEGAGKSTLAAALATRLEREGYDVVCCREPGGTSLGEAVRGAVLDPAHGTVSAWAELFLMLAARAQLSYEIIEPALRVGRVVLCDRFMDASTAYQGGGRELGLERVDALNQLATGGRRPALTFLLDLEPGLGRSRQGHPPDRMEREGDVFHGRVRQAYLELARREPERFVVLDATQSAQELMRIAWDELSPRLRGLPRRSS